MVQTKKDIPQQLQDNAKKVADRIGREIRDTLQTTDNEVNDLLSDYQVGSQQRFDPKAFADKKFTYVSKWRNLESDDYPKIAGFVVYSDEAESQLHAGHGIANATIDCMIVYLK